MTDNRIDIPQIVARSRFVPSPAQIRCRKQFWSSNPQVEADAPMEAVLAAGASQQVRRWWKVPGFSEWFTDRDSNLHAAEELLGQAMERLRDVLTTAEDEQTVIAAAKEARTLHAQLLAANTAPEKFADEQVSRMNRAELEEYIKKHSPVKSTV